MIMRIQLGKRDQSEKKMLVTIQTEHAEKSDYEDNKRTCFSDNGLAKFMQALDEDYVLEKIRCADLPNRKERNTHFGITDST